MTQRIFTRVISVGSSVVDRSIKEAAVAAGIQPYKGLALWLDAFGPLPAEVKASVAATAEEWVGAGFRIGMSGDAWGWGQQDLETALARRVAMSGNVDTYGPDLLADAMILTAAREEKDRQRQVTIDEDNRKRAAQQAEWAAEREAKQAAEEQARILMTAERDAWISAHGSARLKRCMAEGIECAAAYRDERMAAERPGWQWYAEVDGRKDIPRNPGMEAFALLDEARTMDPTAKLVYAGDNSATGYAALAEFLGDEIVYGWNVPEPEKTSGTDYDED